VNIFKAKVRQFLIPLCQRGNQQHEYDKKITKGYGIVFNLHAIEGYSHKEIGALINKKKVQTVLFGLCGD
jgi:hypothetical protein